MTGHPSGDFAEASGVLPPRVGLSSAEAARRLAMDGPNRLPSRDRSPVPLLLLREMVHFFALLLWGAAGLALLAGMPQLAVAIVVVVLLNGAFAFVQEYRADQAGKRLRELIPADVTVRRDSRRTVVDATELVAGDVVLLEAGDRISADLELVEVHALAVNESTLTGESTPARPSETDTAFAGTFVIEGQAEAVVTATGARTRLAAIATLTQAATRPPSPLARRLGRVIKVIAGIALGVGTVFFVLTLLLGMAPADGFLLALGVTVALVPEGLLPTVTLSLARAARSMAGRQALVRHLEAVETLGVGDVHLHRQDRHPHPQRDDGRGRSGPRRAHSTWLSPARPRRSCARPSCARPDDWSAPTAAT